MRGYAVRRSTVVAIVTLLGGAAGCLDSTDRSGASASSRNDERTPADVAVAWNERLLAVAEEEDGFLTLKGVRAAALVHLAIHDALNTLRPRYETFAAGSSTSASSHELEGPSPVAVANAAAFAVAVHEYPDRADLLQRERDRWDPSAETGTRELTGAGSGSDDPLVETAREDPAMETAREDPATETARALGQKAARAVLDARIGDGWDREVSYRWHPMGPGVYAEFETHSGTPKGFVFGAGWAEATPFVLRSGDQFRPGPPPAIDSEAYARAFEEVKRVGARRSPLRTEDQSHLAMWWKEFVEESHNRLARELVVEGDLDLWDAARLFALLNMSIFDGYVASFEAKFAYNHWRPYTAIRWGSQDGNPATIEDPEWTNLHDHTYAFPSYPSAHGTVCAAAMSVMEQTFGATRPFTMTIREVDAAGPMSGTVVMDPPTRSFSTFVQAAEECSLSRVYLGIHFRYDSEAGTMLGRQVGEMVRAGLAAR